MILKFNATMFTRFNYTLLNHTIVDIYVEPWLGANDLIEDIDIALFNLTWHLADYKNDTMLIQLNFSNPLVLS